MIFSKWLLSIKNSISIIAIILLVSFGFVIKEQYKENKKLNLELSKTINNLRQYESMMSGTESDNRVLQLTVEDFKQSNDSLINELDKTRRELGIKDKELNIAISNQTVIKDTIVGVIDQSDEELPIKDSDFTITLEPNQLTSIQISRVGNKVECIPIIYNTQDLFITKKKEYRNNRKHFFDRLIHFDFKKDKIERYQIVNSNDLIKTIDTRVINLSN